MAKTLQLYFSTTEDKKVTLTVDAPRADLAEEEVKAAMQTIIDADVFEIEAASFGSIIGAKIVERTVTDLVTM